MTKLFASFVVLIVAAGVFGYQDEQVRILIGGLLFGAMVGAMCAYTRGYYHGQAMERWAQVERRNIPSVASVRTLEA